MTLDLDQFFDAADLAPSQAGGFALPEVIRVEEAWEIIDANTISHGFIVALASGRRAYFEYTVDHSAGERQEKLDIQTLAGGMQRPDLGKTGQSVFWYGADHITLQLVELRDEGLQEKVG